jgi:hypothetical protein
LRLLQFDSREPCPGGPPKLKMGAGVATSPRFPRLSRPRAPEGAGIMSALGRFRAAHRRPKPPPRVPGSRGPARRPRRFAVRAHPRRDFPELPFRIRHRPGERTPERPSCRARDRGRPLSPRRRLVKSRPSLALAWPAPGGSRPVRVRIGWTFGTAVSVRVPLAPPGFCRGCRARLGRGFHLAAAVAAASSAALALRDPLHEGASRSGCAPDLSLRFRSGRPWPHREAVMLSRVAEAAYACGLRG